MPELAAPNAASNLFQREDLNALSIRLYQVAQGRTVTEAVDALNQNGAGQVYADPNYLTAGMLDAEACGNPNSTGGSPNSTGGSPNSTGGLSGALRASRPPRKRTRISGPLNISAWVPYFKIRTKSAHVNYQGNQIRVGVFDTSPFTRTGELTGTPTSAPITPTGAPTGISAITATEPITWVTPEITLTVNLLPEQVQAALDSLPVQAVRAYQPSMCSLT